jgi:hypothetical protein
MQEEAPQELSMGNAISVSCVVGGFTPTEIAFSGSLDYVGSLGGSPLSCGPV